MPVSVSVSRRFTIVVPDPVDITTTTVPNAKKGVAYSFQLEWTGELKPPGFTATGLPSWLTCSPEGLLAGTPPETGSFEFEVFAPPES